MQFFGIISIIVAFALGVWLFMGSTGARLSEPVVDSGQTVVEELDPVIVREIAAKADLIVLDAPLPNSVILSPLTITGKARGHWFFEGSFPVVLTNWDGLIIAEGVATTESEWMTIDFVPFTATLTFKSPVAVGDPDFMRRGSLILRRDNPSGLPENDDALEVPIYYKLPVSPDNEVKNYHGAIDAAEEATKALEMRY